MSLAGNLKTVSFPDVLQLLATGKKAGILEVKTSTRQKEIAFKGGNIIYASSVNSTEDLLGNMLLNRGKITKHDLDRAISLHKQTGRQLGTTLIDMNLFSKEEISECLKLQIEEIVYNLFSWQGGEFFFHEGKSPEKAPFFIEMNTMNVVMEGTRRIDEWIEIQKVLPPDNVILGLVHSPKIGKEEIRISLDEYRMMAMINGQSTVHELITTSPLGEFVTCRSIYQLIVGKLVEAVGKKEAKVEEVKEDEEEILFEIIFKMYNACFFRIRRMVEDILGEDNSRFNTFASQYRSGIFTYFPGVDPSSELTPSFEKFMKTVKGLPDETRFYNIMSGLEGMLAEQLEYVNSLLGTAVYRDTANRVKKEITEPMTMRRELIKKYNVDDIFYKTLKRADKVVKMVRG